MTHIELLDAYNYAKNKIIHIDQEMNVLKLANCVSHFTSDDSRTKWITIHNNIVAKLNATAPFDVDIQTPSIQLDTEEDAQKIYSLLDPDIASYYDKTVIFNISWMATQEILSKLAKPVRNLLPKKRYNMIVKKTITICAQWQYNLTKRGQTIDTILNLCKYNNDRTSYMWSYERYHGMFANFIFTDHSDNRWAPTSEELNDYILETMNRYNIDYEMIITDWQRKTYKLDSEKYQKAEKIINDIN